MDKHLQTGALGEELACRFLEDQGYRILERNWRYGHKEIDLIAQRGQYLVIGEVKTRSAGAFISARDSVSREKQSFLITAANAYVRQRAIDLEIRYDILAIAIAPDGTYQLEHIPSAFYPQLRRSRTSSRPPRKSPR